MPAKLRIEVFPRLTWRGKRWYFRVRSDNGEIIAQSEDYRNRGDCLDTAKLLRGHAFDAVIGIE